MPVRGRSQRWRVARGIATLGAVTITVAVLAGCGGGGIPGDAVAQVGESTITKAMLDHWTPIEDRLAYELRPTQPLPPGVVPLPPHYTACIALLEATSRATVHGQPKPTAAQLKSECQKRYARIRAHMLEILIYVDWFDGEAKDKHITLTRQELSHELAKYIHQEFHSDVAFHSYLTYTGQSLADALLIIRKDVLITRFEEKSLANAHTNREQALGKILKDFQTKWTAKTNCRTGYIVPNCKQYKAQKPNP